MKVLYVVLCLFIFSNTSYAEMLGSKWVGKIELYTGENIFCSYDESKNPEVLKNKKDGSLSVSRLGGLVFINFRGGCSKILFGGLVFKVIDEKIMDARGQQVGTMTSDKIEIENFNSFLNHIFVKSLVIEDIGEDKIDIDLVFTHSSVGQVMTFVSNMQKL